jgi:hypothetical protein
MGDQIEAMIQRFPQHAATVRRLETQDPSFRAICDDYSEALRALGYWQTTAASSSQKVAEYRQVVAELEAEALAVLRVRGGA